MKKTKLTEEGHESPLSIPDGRGGFVITPELEKRLSQLLGDKVLSVQLAEWIVDPRRENESLFSWVAEFVERRGLDVEEIGSAMRALVTRNSSFKGVILEEAKRLRLVVEEGAQ